MMTQEAIQGLKNLFSEYELTLPNTDSLEILHMAIDAFEKQIPKKPDKSQRDSRGVPLERCPSCYSFGILKYCANCGQKD